MLFKFLFVPYNIRKRLKYPSPFHHTITIIVVEKTLKELVSKCFLQKIFHIFIKKKKLFPKHISEFKKINYEKSIICILNFLFQNVFRVFREFYFENFILKIWCQNFVLEMLFLKLKIRKALFQE